MATQIEADTIEEVVDTIYVNNKTCENLFVSQLVSYNAAEYIASRINSIFDDNNELRSIEIIFLLYDAYNDSNELHLGKYWACHDEDDNPLDIDEVYPDKIVLEYYLPEFMMTEYEVQDSIISSIMGVIVGILENAGLIPRENHADYSHPESLEHCSSDNIFSLKISW